MASHLWSGISNLPIPAETNIRKVSKTVIAQPPLSHRYRSCSRPFVQSVSLSVTVQACGGSDSVLSSHSAVVAPKNYCFHHNGPQH